MDCQHGYRYSTDKGEISILKTTCGSMQRKLQGCFPSSRGPQIAAIIPKDEFLQFLL